MFEYTDWDAATAVASVDIDADGDIDLVVGHAYGFPRVSDDLPALTVYENQAGEGTFQPIQDAVLTEAFSESFIEEIWAEDLDGDGDPDLLVRQELMWGGGDVAWFENVDGRGTFGPANHVGNLVADLVVSNIDSDPEMELAVIEGPPEFKGSISFFELGEDKHYHRTRQQPIAIQGTDYRNSRILAGDVDGDGDVDLVSSHGHNRHIQLHENIDSNGLFGNARRIEFRGSGSPKLFDMHADGDLDLVTSNHTLVNLGGWDFADGRGFLSVDADSMLFDDVDGDSDPDVLGWDNHTGNVFWIANADGTGDFGAENEPQAIRFTPEQNGNLFLPIAVDIDGDHDLDVLIPQDWSNSRLVLYENHRSGDANNDGNVNFADFLALSSNFGAIDASWRDGDFNQDGKVSFEDFLILSTNFHSAI